MRSDAHLCLSSVQVSKTAPTGEYLTTGSFMIRGECLSDVFFYFTRSYTTQSFMSFIYVDYRGLCCDFLREEELSAPIISNHGFWLSVQGKRTVDITVKPSL